MRKPNCLKAEGFSGPPWASGLAESAPMMPSGASPAQQAAADGAPKENPVSNRAGMVIPLNPEGMGIIVWPIFFSENFEGMGRGMGNSKELYTWAQFFFGIASESERQLASKNHDFYRCSSLSKMSIFFWKNNDDVKPHPFPPSLQRPLISATVWVKVCFLAGKSWLEWLTPYPSQGILREWELEWEFTWNGKHATIPWPFANAIPRIAKGMNIAEIEPSISFFFSWVFKTQPNHWTKRMANTRLAT